MNDVQLLRSVIRESIVVIAKSERSNEILSEGSLEDIKVKVAKLGEDFLAAFEEAIKRLEGTKAGKYIEPIVTLTSGGGPGVGIATRDEIKIGRFEVGFAIDADVTGPGLGILLPAKLMGEWFGWIAKFTGWKKGQVLARKLMRAPGKLYLGFEFLGIIPIPHIGLAVGVSTEEKQALKDFWTSLKKEDKYDDIPDEELWVEMEAPPPPKEEEWDEDDWVEMEPPNTH